MYDRTGNYLIVAILIGMILGVVTVAIFGESMLPVKFLGDIFLNALKMVVIPLLFCSMIVGISNLGDVRKLGRTGLKTLLYFLVTSSIAVVIGLILVNVFQPGSGFNTLGASVPDTVSTTGSYSFFTWLADQIPSNIIGAASETKVLPIIVFALFFGGVLTTLGPKGRPVITFFEGVNEAIMKIVHIIMWFAPIGIFGLVAGQLAASGGISGFSGVISALGWYSLVVILGLLIHGLIVLPLILKFVGSKNPIEYFVGMSQALMTAFATSSSSATLPVTMECVEENNDIDKRASSFVLPLGATINMDGTALYEAVAAMFIAQAYGIPLPIWSQITIFATAILASVGAAGIPQAGLVTMVLVLQAVGLPLEGIGLILAVDWFLDRCRTTVNVWGDSIGAAVIATTAEIGLVDRQKLKAARSPRSDRFRDLTRRKDPRYKKKIEAPKSGPAKDRGRFKGKKSDGYSRDNSRRPSRFTKRNDRPGDKRAPEVESRGPVFHQTARREEYKPGGETSRESKTGPRPGAGETRPCRNARSKGRRRSGSEENSIRPPTQPAAPFRKKHPRIGQQAVATGNDQGRKDRRSFDGEEEKPGF
jgi:Na+/H+-dicarboxylate symporter